MKYWLWLSRIEGLGPIKIKMEKNYYKNLKPHRIFGMLLKNNYNR